MVRKVEIELGGRRFPSFTASGDHNLNCFAFRGEV